MGRTLATITQIIQEEQTAFANFRRALRREDQRAFDGLFADVRKHTAAISEANHALPLETMLLAMLLEQRQELDRLRRRLDE